MARGQPTPSFTDTECLPNIAGRSGCVRPIRRAASAGGANLYRENGDPIALCTIAHRMSLGESDNLAQEQFLKS